MGDVFVAPGPGEWQLDRSHYTGGVTPISQWLMTDGMQNGFRRVFAELGVPAETIEARFVNGFYYTRLRPLIGADNPPRKPPPTPLLWLGARLHPEFRKRTKAAANALATSPSNAVVDRWHREIRPSLHATNLRLQDVDASVLTDDELRQHVDGLLDHLHDNYELHFWLHGHDLGPIARYLYECHGWGIDPANAIDALAGASPSTVHPRERLHRIRLLVDASETPVASLDDVRAVSDEAASLLDEHLREHGHVLATGYDVTASTLGELPEVVLQSIRTAGPAPTYDNEATASLLRSQVPLEHRDAFDHVLADARNVMDMRDDQGPMTIEWPAGLLRRALLEAGSRLGVGDHVFELTPDEARRLFGETTPTADELRSRAATRHADAALDPPPTLGAPEAQPPLGALPTALATTVAMVQLSLKYTGLAGERNEPPLSGTGVGSTGYTGRAVVADSADDAMERLAPGDVLVVRATSPAFNLVLSIAGAVVTVDGGAMSHAAVLARELGIPAVIGASGALSITDGAMVEVDPVAGVVRPID
ncbi:MAG TPA: PEP-utilizing enzyme [Ilumatobacteraceae bacterium]|nr:PEP-utilizing enzyme [Ilumatobacteraceae bacterium]